MNIGTNVIFNEENYTIKWIYDNGNCEIIRQNGLGQIELVSLSELETFEKTIEYC